MCVNSLRCHSPRKRGIQYAAASRSITIASGILDRPIESGDDSEYVVGCAGSLAMTHLRKATHRERT
ncbi:hypothetical protein XH93_04525 [Bradyrhizobium sp. CCBAU 51753]|nr:hypothetical protein XH93_04525 [Bradyrhizobium sp. CCBAU 51753]